MGWLPVLSGVEGRRPITIILTSGASCPDTLLDRVMLKVLGMVEGVKDPVEVLDELIG
jgi:4-hydroxy-3-methylbut-2-enyl diphosphate reductase